MKTINKIEPEKILNPVVIGYIISISMSIILLFVYALILVNTNISENTIKTVVIIITGISIIIGSSISCRKVGKNGILKGLSIGGLYMLTLYILSSMLITGFTVTVSSIIMIFIGLILGAIGGIIGINLK